MTILARRDIPNAIARREDFKGSHIEGARTTPIHSATIMTGHLPDRWRDRLVDDMPVYVVWSYDTPIAWVDINSVVTIPAVNYGVTTSNHQGLAATGLGRDYNFRTVL